MVFKGVHTASVEHNIRKNLRAIVTNPYISNKRYIKKGYLEQLVEGTCLLCQVLARIQKNSKIDLTGGFCGKALGFCVKAFDLSKDDPSTVLHLQTPCLKEETREASHNPTETTSVNAEITGKADEEEDGEKSEFQNGENDEKGEIENEEDPEKKPSEDEEGDEKRPHENGKDSEKCKFEKGRSITVDVSKLLNGCCMRDNGGSLDVFRLTIKEILTHALNNWIGAGGSAPARGQNVKCFLNRVLYTDGAEVAEDRQYWMVYQLFFFWAWGGRNCTLVVSLCKLDDLKLLLNQSYAFFMDVPTSTLTAFTYNDFDLNPSLRSVPCSAWVKEIFDSCQFNTKSKTPKERQRRNKKEKGERKGMKMKVSDLIAAETAAEETVGEDIVAEGDVPAKKRKDEPA